MFIHTASHKQTITRCTATSIDRQRHWHKRTQKVISYYETEQIEVEKWVKNGKIHRGSGGPAAIKYYENGHIEYREWYKDGKEHRIGGAPAYISYFENGKIRGEMWYEDEELHRVDAPAVITYFKNGTVKEERYCVDGKYQYNRVYNNTV